MTRSSGAARLGRARQALRPDEDPLATPEPTSSAGPAREALATSAAVVRQFERQLRDAHAPMLAALSIPCRHHDAAPGHWCWPGPLHAVCGRRLHYALSSAGLAPSKRPYPQRMAHYAVGGAA